MERYFNFIYEFDKDQITQTINRKIKATESNYICVADGNILRIVNQDKAYRSIVNNAMFSICDSSWVPIFIKLIYGFRREQYCGAMIFKDIVSSCKYRMFFMGTSQRTLMPLQSNLISMNPAVKDMAFYELPFLNAEDFDYPSIAKQIELDKADIIWVALGAPKQEIFMSKLKPYLKHGIMIGVGAVFKFYSGLDEKRAPSWMIKNHMEFVYRIFSDPKKQLKRCFGIIVTLPRILFEEWRRKKRLQKLEDNS